MCRNVVLQDVSNRFKNAIIADIVHFDWEGRFMAAQLINGKEVSVKRLTKVTEAVVKRQEDGLREPCLAVILVGNDPASAVYVRNKKLACENAVSVLCLMSCPNRLPKKSCWIWLGG